MGSGNELGRENVGSGVVGTPTCVDVGAGWLGGAA